MTKRILILLFLVHSVSYAMANRPTLHWLEGIWAGTGGDVNSTFNWTIKLTYSADESFIHLVYPSHNCGGSLKIISIETGKAVCLEDVNYGLGSCSSGLKVLIHQEPDGSIILDYYLEGKTTMKSTATLKRIA